ncbi:hypothetical protein [Paenibacillus caui]|uniref:hypothetical protein n=1 Tax=Paenibacillus caui TaxID=2873927 RepID=UPI001CA7C7AB|nr:hypothetical protein [Paenibacillus caui]
MNDFRTLKLLDRFRGAFEGMGVQYDQMRRILQVKLTMDGRRVPTIVGNSSRRQKGTLLGGRESSTLKGQNGTGDDSNRFIRSLWVYALLGIVMIPFVIMGNNYMFQMSFVFGIMLFMVMTSLISDFSSVLLDIRDKNILYSKPLNHRTISMAKTIHILIYMLFITAAIMLPSLLVGLIRNGIVFFLIFLVEIVLMDFLIVALTAFLYFLVLRFFDGEKLKDVINYVQIGLTIGITIGYQLVFRLFDFVDFSFRFQPKWWQFLLPPVWFAGPFEYVLSGDRSGYVAAFSLLTLLLPIAGILLYIKMMPAFERNLQKLSEQTGRESKGLTRLWRLIGKWMCRTREEAVFFGFASAMMAKEREFKLKVYPTLGFSIIFPFIFLFTNLQDGRGLSDLATGKMYLFIYFCGLLVPSVVIMLGFSGQHKGAWIFRAIPIQDMNAVYKGTLKAFLVRLLVPLFLIEAIIFTAIFGLRIIPDLIAVLLCLFLYTFISYLLLGPELPFSEPFQAVQTNRSLKMIPLMLILAAFGFVHYAATVMSYGVYLYMGILLIANIIAWHRGFTDVSGKRGFAQR